MRSHPFYCSTMRSHYLKLLPLAILGVFLAACDTVDAPLTERDLVPQAQGPDAQINAASSDACVELLNPTDPYYKVCYEGASYDARADQTTFSYTAYATGNGVSSSDNFFLEIPLDLVNRVKSTSPKKPVQFVEKTYAAGTAYGAEWGNSVSRKGRSYAYTFSGHVGEGKITTLIEGSGYATYATVTGPASATSNASLQIVGTVFNDTDQPGSPQSGIYGAGFETPLGGVTLDLLDADQNVVETLTTNPDGSYLFDGLAAGAYTVVVAASNSLYATYAGEPIYVFTSDLNIDVSEELAKRSATLGPDNATATLDFGFWVDGSLLAAALTDPNSEYATQFAEKTTITSDDDLYWASILNGLFYSDDAGTETYAYSYETKLNGYVVSFRGRSTDGVNTTYYYRVRDARAEDDVEDRAQPELSHFTLEYDAVDDGFSCPLPKSTVPGNAEIGPDPTTGIQSAVKWNEKIPTGGYKDFSVTFAGANLRPGAVQGALKNGTNVATDFLPGPCARAVASASELEAALQQVILPEGSTGTTSSYLFLNAFNDLFTVRAGQTLQGAVHALVTPLPNPLPDPTQDNAFDEQIFMSLTISKQVKFLLGLSTPATSLGDWSFLTIEAYLTARYNDTPASKSGFGAAALGGDGGTIETQSSLRAF